MIVKYKHTPTYTYLLNTYETKRLKIYILAYGQRTSKDINKRRYKHMRRYSMSLVIREKQTKTIIRYQFIPTRRLKLK